VQWIGLIVVVGLYLGLRRRERGSTGLLLVLLVAATVASMYLFQIR
jgi:hypothetical protein